MYTGFTPSGQFTYTKGIVLKVPGTEVSRRFPLADHTAIESYRANQ